LSRFREEVKHANRRGLTDINKHSENVLVPLFSELFTLPNLRSLNAEVSTNYRAIDLADESARVAFQITAESGIRKIRHTIEQFLKGGFHSRYERLIIYLLTKRQKSYSDEAIRDVCGGHLLFSCERDILDSESILRLMENKPTESLSVMCGILEAEFGDSRADQVDPLLTVDLTQSLVEIYRRRWDYTHLKLRDLERLVRESTLKRFPILYWCREYKEEVVTILERLFIQEDFLQRGRACRLWAALQNLPFREHITRMNRLGLGRELDAIYRRPPQVNLIGMRDKWASKGLPDCNIIEAIANGSNEDAVNELRTYAKHGDKVIRRTLAYFLFMQHNFAAVDLLIELLEDTDIGVQWEALCSLASIGTSSRSPWALHDIFLDSDIDIYRGLDEEKFNDNRAYSPLFPAGLSSNWDLLHDKLEQFDLGNQRFDEKRIGVLAVCGNAKDLDLLLCKYVSVLEWGSDSLRWESIRALNLMDERLYGQEVLGTYFKKLPAFYSGQWWY